MVAFQLITIEKRSKRKTIPPCEYDLKVENKKISRSRSKRSEACYLIREYA